MAALQLVKSQLLSRVTRSSILQGAIRTIDLTNQIQEQQNNEGNIIQRLWSGIRSFAGFLWGVVRGIGVSFQRVFGWLQARWNEIWNFNWNATDASLNASIQQQNIAIAAAWGGALGGTLGWVTTIAIGAGIAYVMPVIGGAALAKAVAGNVLPEAREEIGGLFRNAINVTLTTWTRQATTAGYIQIRRMLRSAPRGVLVGLFGEQRADFIQNQWGREGQPNISFAARFENWVEQFSPAVQAFIEEFSDEFWDSFTEAGYLIAGELDSAVMQAKAGAVLNNGVQRTVTIQPDRRIDEEKVIFSGTENQVRGDIQTYLNTQRAIAGRDVGAIVGQPANDWMRGQPQRRKLTIVFMSKEQPPYGVRSREVKSATYTIPEPRSTLSWERIKRAAKFYTWGKFRATANLDNGRQMAVYGATAIEAENKLKELKDLTSAEIVSLSVTEEKDRNARLRKDPTVMYPAYGTMLVRRPTTELQSRTNLNGDTYEEEFIKFDLWCDEEPEEFSRVRFGVIDAE